VIVVELVATREIVYISAQLRTAPLTRKVRVSETGPNTLSV